MKPTNTIRSRETRLEARNQATEVPKATNGSARWLNWFSKSETATEGETSMVHAGDDPISVDKNRPRSTIFEAAQDVPNTPKQRRNSEPSPIPLNLQQEDASRSWLSFWGNVSSQTKKSPSVTAVGIAPNPQPDSNGTESQTGKILDAELGPVSTANRSQQLVDGTKTSYGWAFWSKDQPNSDSQKARHGSEVGKLALAGSSSQATLESALVDEAREVQNKVVKRQRLHSLQASHDPKEPQNIGDNAQENTKSSIMSLASKPIPKVDAGSKEKRLPENLLLPSLRTTYRAAERPSLIQQISRLLQMTSSSGSRHVNIVQNIPRVKRALAIVSLLQLFTMAIFTWLMSLSQGVHGYFPAPLIRSVLGQPTGTSIRFANGAASAIQVWTRNQGYSCEIERVALEGEGKIAERIDLLWKLLLNWIDKIRKADFVMVACHSQGVPVAMMLVAKLIEFGCVNSAKIGVCAMAGVNLGPFTDYKSRWISGSAGELFEFALPNSQVSKDYEAALGVALRFGVKIVYIGSIDDQLVSLEVRFVYLFLGFQLTQSFSPPRSAVLATHISIGLSS